MWNYQDFYSGATFTGGKNSITSGADLQITANFNYLYSDANGLKFASLKTMIHEMWHIFGLKDLYRSETNSRVYYMSAMSNAISPIPMSVEIMKTVGKQKDRPIEEQPPIDKIPPIDNSSSSSEPFGSEPSFGSDNSLNSSYYYSSSCKSNFSSCKILSLTFILSITVFIKKQRVKSK